MKRIDLDDEVIHLIALDYKSGLRGKTISSKYNLSPGKIYKTLRESGNSIRTTSRRKYNIDENMFSKIDCEWKAYLLGLFFSDGCVRRLNVNLGLHEKDKELMEKLTKILGVPLKFIPPKSYISKGKLINNHGKYFFDLNSIKLTKDLIKLGCSPQKSLTLKFPSYESIPKEVFHHFIRGYFDGDGCIQPYTFHIVGSNEFCIGFQEWLIKELKISSYLRRCNKVSRVMVHKLSDIKKIKKYLYLNATLYLTRKRNKFRD